MSKVSSFLQIVAMIACACFYIFLIVAITFKGDGKGTYYNCSIAEISPDFPLEAKELCRKQRSGRV